MNVVVVTSNLGNSGGIETLKSLLKKVKLKIYSSNIFFYFPGNLNLLNFKNLYFLISLRMLGIKILRKKSISKVDFFIFSDFISWENLKILKKINNNAKFGCYIQHIEFWDSINTFGKNNISSCFKDLNISSNISSKDKKIFMNVKKNIRFFDFIIFNSNTTKKNFFSLFGKNHFKKILTLFPPIFDSNYKPRLDVGLSWRGLDWKKDFKIIELIKKIKIKYSDNVRFIFLGVPFSKINMVSNYGDFKIWCSKNKFREYLNKLDLFLYHSNLESFGIPPLETYLYSNTPILTVNVPSVEELIISAHNSIFKNSNLRVCVSDFDELEKNLSQFIDNKIILTNKINKEIDKSFDHLLEYFLNSRRKI